jgi:6-phosphogluconolactonase (cycloisomerase 2 family)
MTQSGQYLVLADYFDTELRSLKVNPTSGELTQASQVSIPETALYLTTDSSGQYAYVQLSNSIAAYKLNAQTGKLTAVPGSPFASGPATCCPGSSLSASKKYLYALNDDQTISGFAINPNTGRLTKLKNFPLSSPLVQGLALDPVHNFLITAHSSNNYVTSYLNLFSINPSTGALKTLGRFGVGQVWGPFTLRVDPSARILYVSDLSQESCAFDACVGAVATFLIDGSNERLRFFQNDVSTGEPYDYRQTLAPVR